MLVPPKGCRATNKCDYAVKVIPKQDIGTPKESYFLLSPGETLNDDTRCVDFMVKKKRVTLV